MKKFAVIFAFLWTAVGCSSSISDYKHATPTFDLFQYFEGRVLAWGMVQDFTGIQTRRFSVELTGTREGNTLTLNEDFLFDDGETQNRIWVIDKQRDGSYQGRADDVVGIALGAEQGNALHWVYELAVDVDGSTYVLTLDDWMFRQDDKRVFNLTSMKKFGVEVGRVTLFFEKQ
ncbi:DUF3833 domain-containing protein [Enterovibrio sp. ZSDZ35]|uniref:DUF3833 domain-containing protein n=1 Tax=Enterovibrio qingdaonensis TaxID=2899818 RepID=A0ABT5QF92_9GAMM|nr:DUF3833 domain-containing protein [Enterovibrio sp. ZSDZ35]MDD1779645.1 DUF3833 domain-containing protein [Enterovibrio sp. ZSDZ35]